MGITSNVRIVERGIGVHANRVRAAASRAVHDIATHLEAQVKSRAAGRPGPRRQTGDYSRSIATVFTVTPGGAEAWVGTNKAQGRRLEYGFVGRDAAGRTYAQPPYPHWQPAIRVTRTYARERVRRLIREAA